MLKRMILTVAGLVIMFAVMAGALEFSADMVTKDGGKTMNSKMNYANDRWRLDTTTAGKRSITIVRADKKLVWMMLPEQQLYTENKMQPEMLRGMSQKTAGETKRQKLGRETVNGIACDKYEVTYREGLKTKKTYLWLSADNWPVKSAATDGSWSTEFKNFKKADQPDSLFVVPAGYNKLTVPGFKMPPGTRPMSVRKDLKLPPGE